MIRYSLEFFQHFGERLDGASCGFRHTGYLLGVDEKMRAPMEASVALQRSIGIELVNRGYVEDAQGRRLWYPYSDEQIDALIVLLKDIMQRHGLKPGAIVGHSDIAPQRKVDPGPLFPWKRLADAGLVPWPNAAAVERQRGLFAVSLPEVGWFQAQLARQGYEVPRHGQLDLETRNVLAAFQMKYRPARFDGQPDAETAALLAVLNAAG